MADLLSLLGKYLHTKSEEKAREGLKTIDDVSNIFRDRIQNSNGQYGPPLPNEALPQELALANTVGQGVAGAVNPKVPFDKLKNSLSKYSKSTNTELEALADDLEHSVIRGADPTELNNIKQVLEVRQKAPVSPSGLALDEASRMARAKDMGFDTNTTWYHGTRNNFKEFNPDHYKTVDGVLPESNKMTFFSKDPKFANDFSGISDEAADAMSKSLKDNDIFSKIIKPPKNSNVIPVHLRTKKTFDYENPEHFKHIENLFSEGEREVAKQGDWELLERNRVRDKLRELGFDSMFIKENGQKNIGVFDPSKIRSKFAEFDPDRMFSKDISAGIGAVTGAGVASQLEEDDKFSKLKNYLKK